MIVVSSPVLGPCLCGIATSADGQWKYCKELGQAGSANSDAGGPFLFYFLECTLILYHSDAFPPFFWSSLVTRLSIKPCKFLMDWTHNSLLPTVPIRSTDMYASVR